MGKAAEKRLDAKKRLLFETRGDDRSCEERAHARAMLDALQKKLEDDALREDGFCFLDSGYVAARRPRTTSGVKMRSYDDHARSVKAVALVGSCGLGRDHSAHTSKITCCAVSKELKIVVTAGLDKMLKFWSLESGRVLETVREAHASPITCYALTSQMTMQNPDGILVATGGKDNLVKVWRRNNGPPSQSHAECTYSLSGHYDALTSCAFDESGAFLITTGDDTNVIAWRVVPSRIENPLQYSDRQATRLRLSWKQLSPNGALTLSFTIRCLPENSVFVPVLELSIPIVEPEAISSLTGGAADDKANAKRTKATATKLRSSAAKKPAKPSSSTGSSAPPPPTDVSCSYVVEGLWAGEIYQFVAAAENRCGLGEFSRVSDYVEMDPTAPDPPSQPQIVNIQKRQVDVVWEKPKCNGSEILQYTLEWAQDDSIAREDGAWTKDNRICTSESSPASDMAVTLCDVPDKPARLENAGAACGSGR